MTVWVQRLADNWFQAVLFNNGKLARFSYGLTRTEATRNLFIVSRLGEGL